MTTTLVINALNISRDKITVMEVVYVNIKKQSSESEHTNNCTIMCKVKDYFISLFRTKRSILYWWDDCTVSDVVWLLNQIFDSGLNVQ